MLSAHFLPSALLLLASGARSAPAAVPGITTTTVLTTFDEGLNFTAGSITGSAPTIPGPYRSLNWTGFEVTFDNGPGPDCDFICAHSYPFRVGFGGSRFTAQNASISSVYDKSRVLDFQLQSFYFGCAASRNLTAQGDVPPGVELPLFTDPANCTLTVKGYRLASYGFGPVPFGLPSPKPDVVQKISYSPDQNGLRSGVLGPVEQEANMAQANLTNAFRGMRYVTFEAAPGPFALSAPIVFMDNFQYVTRNLTLI